MKKSMTLLVAILTLFAGITETAKASSVFIVDPMTDTIVEHDFSLGIVGSIPTPEQATWGMDGLAHSNSSIFYVNSAGTNIIYELDPSSGAVLSSFDAPTTFAGTDGLAFIDGYLYSIDFASSTIFKIDPATHAVESSCVPSGFGTGITGELAGGDGRLFAVRFETEIVELNPATCAVINSFFSPNYEPAYGLAFDGVNLFVSGIFDVFKLDPSTGAVISTVSPGFQPSALASRPTTILTITKAGAGSETVASSPSGIDCGTDCSWNYTVGTVVVLTATADAGSTFAGWSGDADCSDGTVTMNAAMFCTATFDLLPLGPVPDVKANGFDGPVVIAQGAPLSFTTALNPGEIAGNNADWWVWMDTPQGKYWYSVTSGWERSDVPIRGHAGSLIALSPRSVLNSSTLPVGNYNLSFAVDDNMDGVFDATYTDAVDVTIQ